MQVRQLPGQAKLCLLPAGWSVVVHASPSAHPPTYLGPPEYLLQAVMQQVVTPHMDVQEHDRLGVETLHAWGGAGALGEGGMQPGGARSRIGSDAHVIGV
jgi:hypothetical protein